MSPEDHDLELVARRRESLAYAFGPLVMEALSNPDVEEIMLNDDGRLWIEANGGMRQVGTINENNAFAILSQVSSALNGELTRQKPFVEGELTLFNGERFEGVAPPVVEKSIFAIRKKPSKIYRLAEYVRRGMITFRQSEILRKALRERANILVFGGTGSGKTTFCNALLAELSDLLPTTRMLILEDTRELQCSLENRVFMRSSHWTSMADIAIAVNRLRPDSISVGEVRYGAPTLALLKLWNTGHPGGLGTAHANSAYEGLTRLDELVQEVSAHPQRELIGRAVDVIVFLERDQGNKRRIKEIIRVDGWDTIAQRFIVEEIK